MYGQYNDTSGTMVPYMPVYKDLSDSAEYNVQGPVPITVGTNNNTVQFGQNQKQSAGRVVTASNFNAGTFPQLLGAYTPEVPGTRPSTGDIIRITRWGPTPVGISGGQAPNVGDFLEGGTQLFRTTASTNPSSGAGANYAGRITGTAGQISAGAAINPVAQNVPGFPAFQYFIVNAWVDQ